MNMVHSKQSVPAAGGNGRPRPLRVLVVEGDPDIVKSTALVLRLHGHEVHVAIDGETALRLAERSPPDVALIDLGLAGMDGCQLARRLQQQCGDKILFIAVNSAIAGEDRPHAAAAGIHLHCPATTDPDILLAVLNHYATVRR